MDQTTEMLEPDAVPADTLSSDSASLSNPEPAESADSASFAEEPETPLPETSTVIVCFVDFLGEPIANLPYKLVANAERLSGTTSELGETTKLSDLKPGATIEIFVKKEHSGEFKRIGVATARPGETTITALSAKIRLECESEPHEGEAGEADSNSKNVIPPATLPAAMATKPPAPSKPAPAASTPTSTVKSKTVAAPTRNQRGHPVVRYHDTPMDRLQRKIAAVFNLWTWNDFPAKNNKPLVVQKGGRHIAQQPVQLPNVTQGHPTINPPSKAASGALSPAEAERLNALCGFMEQQVMLDYAGYPSATLAVRYKKQADVSFPSKRNVSKGQCLKYVKIGILRAGYTNGVSGTEYARDSGSDWLKFGFREVSNTLPKVTVVLRDDKEIVQPDVIYTWPGDVIVYDKIGDPKAAGHIDVRTYHGFVSDFAWRLLPDVRKYRVLGVYRKISDALAPARAQAFLRILRDHEAKGFKNPYQALRFDPKNRPNTHVTFEGSDHPSNPTENKPAGAYQIKFASFDETVRDTGWKRSFTPDMQDRIALLLLQRRPRPGPKPGDPPAKTALGYVLEGKIEEAVNETKLWNEWACLPGGGKQSHTTMDQLKRDFEMYCKEYSR